jgi:hypothetical protein
MENSRNFLYRTAEMDFRLGNFTKVPKGISIAFKSAALARIFSVFASLGLGAGDDEADEDDS